METGDRRSLTRGADGGLRRVGASPGRDLSRPRAAGARGAAGRHGRGLAWVSPRVAPGCPGSSAGGVGRGAGRPGYAPPRRVHVLDAPDADDAERGYPRGRWRAERLDSLRERGVPGSRRAPLGAGHGAGRRDHARNAPALVRGVFDTQRARLARLSLSAPGGVRRRSARSRRLEGDRPLVQPRAPGRAARL